MNCSSAWRQKGISSLRFLRFKRSEKAFEQSRLCASVKEDFTNKKQLKVTNCITFLRVLYFQVLFDKSHPVFV